MASTKWLKIGIVGRAHGLRGSFFVSGRDEAIPPSIKSIRLGTDPELAADLAIESRHFQNGRAQIKVATINDRTASELLTGKTVWASFEHLAVDDEEEYLLSDVEGRTVYDDAGVVVGVIEQVYPTTAGANLVVLNSEKNADVEIPMSPVYVDMSFKRGTKELKLVVPMNTFEEIWNSRSKKK